MRKVFARLRLEDQERSAGGGAVGTQLEVQSLHAFLAGSHRFAEGRVIAS